MSEEHLDHALAEEFAGHATQIHALKTTDAHFRQLLGRNHDLWREIHRLQSGVEAGSDARLEALEKQRLAVLDQIAARLQAR
jgi:uncharacterized protein YdcH (DUF465 family)